jgi:hypothetical protein
LKEWLYSRAVATAFAASAGFDVPLFGRKECTKGTNVAVCEAAMATGLAVLHPVLVGTFGNYCGRIHLAQLPASDTLLERFTELRDRGVDVIKVLVGAAWTVGRHHTPQVESERLAATIVASGAALAVVDRLRAVRDAKGEDWENRFRAAVLLLRLEGKRPEERECAISTASDTYWAWATGCAPLARASRQ